MGIILVVDDDAVDRELAERCLEPLDEMEILHAKDGSEALELLVTRPAELVLTDLRMPGMDGLELVGKVKASHPLIPVVLMTSKGNEIIAVQALEAGAASYVPKSELKKDLVETVEQVLDVAESRRSKHEVLKYFGKRETRFELTNDLSLITPLAGYFQDGLERLELGDEALRTKVGMALMEALSNAIIHGNLEVSSELRDDDPADYYSLIEQRRKEKPYATRRVRCKALESRDRIDYIVEDEGPGFDHAALPDPAAPENVVRVRGRGLMLIGTFMDEVEFNDAGNRIRMTKKSVRLG